MQIHLKGIKLHAYHGVAAGEEIVGSEYEINLMVSIVSPTQPKINIDHTVDYTNLYQIVKECMATPQPLLESVAIELSSEIIAKFSLVNEVEISIFKLHPPIESFIGSVGVTHKQQR